MKSIVRWALGCAGLALAAGQIGTAAAAPPSFDGRYSFESRIDLLTTREVQVVNTLSPEGKTYLLELRQKGFTCSFKGNSWYSCARFRKDLSLPESLAARFRDRYRGKLNLTFLQSSGKPEKVVEGETYEEWILPQRVQILGQVYDDFRYLKSQGVEKLVFGESGKPGHVELVLQSASPGQFRFGLWETASTSVPGSTPAKAGSIHYYVLLGLD